MNRKTVSVKQMIDRHLHEYEKVRLLGKTKRATVSVRVCSCISYQERSNQATEQQGIRASSIHTYKICPEGERID
ncbi:Chorismate mutase [Pseudomonas syringae pv. antirrhini]|uniref:Chorismate mutase n=1 Tax=Pseudomonas syringae pv. antirrhini TaxID=251702 RepID=A0A0N8QQ87_9PSED|nr:Chorismate mutase [Pseudomonas syringae pv. apii]KPW52502.1 Chorismate mutase [Pseudomonas syringae pv. antirrhini]RMP34486.1 Chorismate mutase [Pseudomonas syringae pv. antirrhini]RMW27019.1 Chorismate mutase [Pseudomonas syringae pv. antirrhini]